MICLWFVSFTCQTLVQAKSLWVPIVQIPLFCNNLPVNADNSHELSINTRRGLTVCQRKSPIYYQSWKHKPQEAANVPKSFSEGSGSLNWVEPVGSGLPPLYDRFLKSWVWWALGLGVLEEAVVDLNWLGHSKGWGEADCFGQISRVIPCAPLSANVCSLTLFY